MPVVLSSTFSQTLSNDVDGDGNVSPGDILSNELVITNSGDTTATDITATLTENGMTVDPGSVQIGPIANDDTINITGNTPVIITTAQLIGNDSDPDGNSANLTVANVSAGSNGTIVDNGDGTWTFTPDTGFTGTASFTYDLVDEDGVTSVETAPGEVTVNVTGLVWYVDSAYDGSNGPADGSYDRPFTSLASVNGAGGSGDADGAGDTIFIYDRGGLSGNLQLEANQTLVGDGTALVVNGIAIGASNANTSISHSGVGVTLSTGNTISGIDLVGTTTSAVAIADGNGTVGTLNVSGVGIFGQGQILDVDQGGTLNVQLNSAASTGSAGANGGVIDVTGASGTFTVTGATSITGSHGQAGIDLSGNSGLTATFSGTVTANLGANGAINIGSNTGANSFTFSGASNNIDTTSGTAVNFASNSSGSTLTMSGGGLDIDSTTGGGFAATGGGTVTVTGSGNSITSTTGTALNITNTNIGASDVTFQSISANGGTAPGIILNTTGTAGGLHVTGDGTATNGGNGSGGTIANISGADGTMTGIGIYLNNTSDVQLSNMLLQNFTNYGVRGTNVTDFAMTNSTVQSTSGLIGTSTSSLLAEGAVSFGDNNAGSQGVSGTVNISNSVFSDGIYQSFGIWNSSGTTNLTANNTTFSDSGGYGFNFSSLGGGSAAFTGTITNTTVTDNVARGIEVSNAGSGTFNATVNGGTFTNNYVGVEMAQFGTGAFNFNVLNTVMTHPDAAEHAQQININRLGIAQVSGGTTLGAFSGNIIGNSITGNGSNANGIDAEINGYDPNGSAGNLMTVNIADNTVTNVGQYGIHVAAVDGNGTMNATVTGNNVTVSGPFALDALYILNGALSSDSTVVNIDIRNNTLSGVRDDLRIHRSGLPTSTTSVGHIEGYTGAPTSEVSIEAFLNGLNSGIVANVTTSGASGLGWTNIGSVPMPTSPLLAILPDSPEESVAGPDDSSAPVTGGDNSPDSGSGQQSASHSLTQAELDAIVDAAIQRWADAGASDDQLAAMRAASVTIADMAGVYLASSEGGAISIDVDGAGHGWFVDGTPGEDGEFSGSGTLLTATSGGGAAGAMDLLTVVMHELGHQVGLSDTYQSGNTDELMYGYANPGERRLPGSDDLVNADMANVGNEAFALAPAAIGSLEAGSAVRVLFTSTVMDFDSMIIPTFHNYGTLTFNPGAGTVDSNVADLVVETLTLGDRIWLDTNPDGEYEPLYESGIEGVTVSLYADANNDNIADGAAIATTTTDIDGYYFFEGLAEGNYIVSVDASNFGTGDPLEGLVVTGPGADPDNDVDNDSNGRLRLDGSVSSQSITLTYGGEPTVDITGNNTNETVDFGFFRPNRAPAIANVQGNAAIWTEGDSAVQMDVGNNAAVSDPDSDNYAFGSLTVAISSGYVSGEDQLGLADGWVMSIGELSVGSLVMYNGILIGTVGSASDQQISINLTTGANSERVQELIRAFTFMNNGGSNPTAGDRTITYTLVDGDGTDYDGIDSVTVTSTVTVVANDEAPVVQDDAVVTTEDNSVNGSVFADNGNGADSDDDGPTLSVSAVNGSTTAVGTQITLASGALLTVQENGNFNYDPNGAFDALPTTNSGASNTPGVDSFTYTVAGGGTATVTITVYGLDSADVLIGTAGNDELDGGTGADQMSGLAGDDLYFVDSLDTVSETGGEGYDHVVARSSFTLGAGSSVEELRAANRFGLDAIDIFGNGLAQSIYGNFGANRLSGRGGDDLLYGLNGNDILDGGAGDDTMLGGEGDDTYVVDSAADLVMEQGGAGTDRVIASVSYQLDSSALIERLQASDPTGTSALTLTGNRFDQTIQGNAGDNQLNGSAGNDVLIGLGGNDRLIGGGGVDEMRGGTGDDTYYVDPLETIVELGGQGTDQLISSGSFTLAAGVSIEVMRVTGTANYSLTGNELGQSIYGNGGDNVLTGLGGNDHLIGGAGNDRLVGGTGGDVLRGEAGGDTFVFDDLGSIDRITDFEHGIDHVELDHDAFSALSVGALAAGSFRAGTAAQDADDHIIYDSATGNVWYDADGVGGEDAILFLKVNPGTSLTPGDFLIG